MSEVQKTLDRAKKKKEAEELKRNQGSKADMRDERRRNMTKAHNARNPSMTPKTKKIAADAINKRSARTRPEQITRSQKFIADNPKFDRVINETLTEKGFEILPPYKNKKVDLKKGGTVRMASGGPVVDSYDYD